MKTFPSSSNCFQFIRIPAVPSSQFPSCTKSLHPKINLCGPHRGQITCVREACSPPRPSWEALCKLVRSESWLHINSTSHSHDEANCLGAKALVCCLASIFGMRWEWAPLEGRYKGLASGLSSDTTSPSLGRSISRQRGKNRLR